MSAARRNTPVTRARRAPAKQPRAGLKPSVARAERSGPHARVQTAPRTLVVALITVSDTRRGLEDTSGALAAELLTAAGHRIGKRAWVADDIPAIRRALRAALAKREVDAVVLTGGTGVAPRDVTPEAVEPLLVRTLPGFGEGFRMQSWATVGSAAWLSRAGAGVARGRLVVYLPGSAGAVRQALEQLLIPELVHVVRLLGRF